MTVFGLLVGVIHHFSSAAELDVFEAVDQGRLDPRPVPASLLASLASLIGGFSLGPEVPTGMLAAGFSTWLSERRKLNAETTRTNVIGSVSAAYAGLFSSPFALLVMILESTHMRTAAYYGTLLISGLAAALAFSLLFWIGGDTFSTLLGLVQPGRRNWSRPADCLCFSQDVGFRWGLVFRFHRRADFPAIICRCDIGVGRQPAFSSNPPGFGRGLFYGGRSGGYRANIVGPGHIWDTGCRSVTGVQPARHNGGLGFLRRGSWTGFILRR